MDTGAALAGSDGGGGGEGPGSTPGTLELTQHGDTCHHCTARPAAAHPVGDFL